MAPYNSHYGSRYDPVGSQYNQQHHQSYYTGSSQPPASQQRSTTQTPQPQSAAPPGYQPSYTSGYTNQSSYYNNYQSTESRAAETLSHLSAQEHPTTSSSRPTSTAYDTNSRAESSWNASDRPSTEQHESSNSWHNADRRAANPSPLYQQDQRPASTASNYSPAQSYPQPTSNTGTYSYSTYSQSEQPRAQTTTSNHSTSYDYSASNFRASSPYLARQQQQQSTAPRSSVSSVASTAPRDHHLASAAPHSAANVSQPRAPSVTPSSIQQRATSSYARQSNPPDQGYGSGPTTVDPTQVYDPWPEQQRKLAEARRKAEAEEKRRAEEEAKIKAEEEAKRKAEEEVRRKAEEEARKKAEEEARKKAEEEAKRKAEDEAKRKVEEEARRKVEEERKAEEKRKEDAKRAESLRLAREIANQEEAKRRQYQQLQDMQGQQSQTGVRPAVTTVQDTQRMMAAAMAGIAPSTVGAGGGNLESEMAAIFRRMRDLNQADPQMFARMWEMERQAHLTKSQGATQSPTPAPAAVPVAAPARPSQGPARPVFTPAPVQVAQASMVSAPPTQPHVSAPPAQPQVPAPHPATAGPLSRAPSNARKQTASSSVNGPPPPAGANAIWPPGKKATLAETATKWLNARKENLNKLVSVEAIHALLAPNPSYMTLCESLERMGLYVDRAQFARALLSVVPDAAKANNQNKPTSPTLPPAQPPPAAHPSSSNNVAQLGSAAKKQWPNIGKFPGQRGRPSRAAVAALQDRSNVVDLTGRDSVPPTSGSPIPQPYHSGHHASDAPTVDYQSDFHWAPPVDDTPDYNSSYTPPQPSQVATIQNLQAQHRKYSSPYFPQQGQASNVARPTPLPAVPRPPPANKGEAARKRNFAELVDMSAMDSDSDEDMPPAKQANTGQYDMGLTTDQVNNVHSNGHFNPTAPVNLQQYYFNGHVYPTYHPTGASQPSAAATARPMIISKHVELKNQTVVEPVRRAKVARKSRYDPRTICRDVLLATGRHPDMRPLNQHLNVMHNFLKNHSDGVELDKFDLETIRWDLIDPGEPIIEPLEPAEAERESINSEERNIDADDEGGSEDEGGARLTSDIPPTLTVTHEGSTTENTPAPSTSIRRASTNQVVAVEIDTSKGNGGRTRKPFPKANGKQPRKSLPVTASATITNGRSPAKSSIRRHTDLHQRATSSIAPDTPRNKQTLTNMSATPSSSQPIGYSAFRSQVTEFDENGNPIKKKGRPVGWRKSIHSKAALAAAAGEDGAGATPSASKIAAAQRASRGQAAPSYAPPKQRRARQPKPAIVESKEPEVEFNVFKCEWEDCSSELHNIDTLRKHVIKIHGKKTSEDDYECAWSACFKEEEVTAFDDMGSWMAHMENEHIKPITHKLGDGPRAGLSDDYSEISDAYLSDSRGRLVTPIISMTPLKKDTKEWRQQQAREAAARRLTNLTGAKLNDEKLLQQLEEKYRIVGPAMMRAGSTLATAERKRNFLDDEDFYEVVDPSQGPGYPPDSP